eukprot:CAMPEP_0172751284 /NCGR_PEP_ID=MMETSP1074-20121228/151286_1 /TAXON_ID=2916 /ORGANISM="Ceratium fusus, Strain PA161109" /LENGTH=72 /DNA_ID=CAMNT_0013583569 /DNA_START=33 /DNA_END=251 /DNA_ORIENTATION=-
MVYISELRQTLQKTALLACPPAFVAASVMVGKNNINDINKIDRILYKVQWTWRRWVVNGGLQSITVQQVYLH